MLNPKYNFLRFIFAGAFESGYNYSHYSQKPLCLRVNLFQLAGEEVSNEILKFLALKNGV